MVKKTKVMQIQTFINDWLAASNDFNIRRYLEFYLPEAILTDPSVERTFNGQTGIKEYFHNYFITYRTQTKQLSLEIKSQDHVYLEVEFNGDFPEGKIKGSFHFIFKNNKIASVKADLID